MAAAFMIPFNFQSSSDEQGTTGTYTVPSGKYARVTIFIKAKFVNTISGFNTTGTYRPAVANGL